MAMKFLLVLCLGVLFAQGNAQWPGPDEDFDYVIELLQKLESELTSAVRSTTEDFSAALTAIEDKSNGIIEDLTKEFDEIVAPLVEAIDNLNREGADLGIDVSECTDGSIDSINDLPKELLGVTAQCLNYKASDAESVVNEAIAKINNVVSAIDNYWTKIEECAAKTSTQREICIKELESEIGRDTVDIPDEIALIANEALEYLENLKIELLVCTSGRVDYLVEIGEAIVKYVTICVENIFNPTTPDAPTTTTTAAPTTASPTTVPTTESPTTVLTTTIPPLTTTEVPTTSAASTTDSPTTVPTTEPPTSASTSTAATTTVPPETSTEEPTTTAAPTTSPDTSTEEPSTTAAPTTSHETSTEEPSTEEPTTEEPTTEEPTTEEPTTEEPTTEEPTTEEPSTVEPNSQQD